MRQISLITFLYLAIFSTVAFILRRPIIEIFIGETDEEVMYFVEQYLRWMCPSMFLLSFLHVFRGGNIGLGNGSATLISGISELIARGLLTPLLAPLIGFTAICATGPLAWLLCSVLGILLFITKLRKLQKAGVMPPVS